jgi:hypothetical protein
MASYPASAAFAATEAIRAGEWDGFLPQIRMALADRERVLRNPDQPPPKTDAMVASGHQVWAWMNGPGKPHWEVRGTGMIAS